MASGQNSVSVLIPLKNGFPYFKDVCEALSKQVYDASFEVICVDSGSTDGSDAFAEKAGHRVLRIPSSEFGHGRTRNFAASHSNAEFLCFLTHDAVPADENWLSELVRPMRADPRVAGVFSRHIAQDDADPFIAWELEQHFKGLAAFPIVEITDRSAYDADVGMQQIFHFYSDNASAMPRSIWQEHPYPDVQFAEDQIWAKRIVEAGYRKAFAENSVVKHSHSFGPIETLQRSFDEARAFRKLFGYVLSPTLKSSLRSSVYLAKRDMRQALSNGWWRSHPLKTVSRLFESITRPLGHYLGARENLPPWVLARISRDDWIREL